MTLLAIDPGARTGWACFGGDGDRILLSSGAAAPGRVDARGSRVIVEIPESRGGRTATPVDDLITLAYRAGIAAASVGASVDAIQTVRPSVWKGDLPKAVTMAKALAVLGPSDRIPEHRRPADEWDAIALGLWYVGRLRLR